MIINEQYIYDILEENKNVPKQMLLDIIEKGSNLQGLTYEEIAALLQSEDAEVTAALFTAAGKIKQAIYGNRVVMFAPLYISNYCINTCT